MAQEKVSRNLFQPLAVDMVHPIRWLKYPKVISL